MHNKRKTIEDMHKLAKSRGFKFLSPNFSNVSTKHLWKCRNGHEWPATPNAIRTGDGCPYCRTGISEEKCRFILESLTNHKFIKTRTTLEDQLELDGFCQEISLAFEYQGIQHFKKMPWFHESKNTFKAQQKRDIKKRKICKKKSIFLIEIPYTINKNEANLETYIRDKLPVKFIVGEVNWEKFGTKAKLEELKEILAIKNITCLSNVYVDMKTELELHCNVCGYEWKTAATNVQSGHGCHQCAGNMKLSMEKVVEICLSKNIKFLDEEYKNTRTLHTFQCLICIYKWRTTFQCVKRMKCCRRCSLKRAVKARKKYGPALYKKMWETLRKKYGPTGRRKPRLSKEEWRKRKKQAQHRYYMKKRRLLVPVVD